MSLSGLQNSWGGGGGSAPAPPTPAIDIPISVMDANADGTSRYTVNVSSGNDGTEGLVRWDISPLASALGQTLVPVPGGDPVLTYCGTCVIQVTFRSSSTETGPNTGIFISDASTTGSYSISVGVLDAAPTSGDTDLLIAAESVSSLNSPNNSAVYITTVTAAIQTTKPDELYVYLAWYGLEQGTLTNVGIVSVYVTPAAPLTIIPTPIPPAVVFAP